MTVWNGPMDHVNVQIFQLQIFQCFPAGFLNVIMILISQFADNDKILSRDNAVFNDSFQGFTNMGLVAVNFSAIDEAVAILDCTLNGQTNIFMGHVI